MIKPYVQLMIQSSSEKGEWHLLEIWKNGTIKCNCMANLYDIERDIKSKCQHVKKFKELVLLLSKVYGK